PPHNHPPRPVARRHRTTLPREPPHGGRSHPHRLLQEVGTPDGRRKPLRGRADTGEQGLSGGTLAAASEPPPGQRRAREEACCSGARCGRERLRGASSARLRPCPASGLGAPTASMAEAVMLNSQVPTTIS